MPIVGHQVGLGFSYSARDHDGDRTGQVVGLGICGTAGLLEGSRILYSAGDYEGIGGLGSKTAQNPMLHRSIG